MTDAFKLPPEVHHNWKFLAFGPDKKLYIPVGSPCNLCEVNPGVTDSDIQALAHYLAHL